jgi:hypothetical protein
VYFITKACNNIEKVKELELWYEVGELLQVLFVTVSQFLEECGQKEIQLLPCALIQMANGKNKIYYINCIFIKKKYQGNNKNL